MMISHLLSKAERVGSILSGGFILVMMFLTVTDVFLRYVFHSPLRGNYELQPIFLIGVVYLAASRVQSQRGHIALDVISSHLSKPNQLTLQLFGDIIFLIFSALVAWQFSLATWEAWVTNDYFMGGLIRFPLWPPYLVITLGTGLLSLRLIEGISSNPLWRKELGISFLGLFIRLAFVVVVLSLVLVSIYLAMNANLEASTIGIVVIGLFMVLYLLGTPIGAVLGIVAIAGFWILGGGSAALGVTASVPFSAVGRYAMTVMPLFIIMGSFAALAGFAEEGFNLAKHWLERIPGGIIHATTVGATAFGAASGGGAGACATLAKVAIPEMDKQGIKRGMSIGVVATASTLAVMIPPSGVFVIYAMLTGNSVGKLLIAGIIPGLIGAALIMIMVAIRCWIDPSQTGSGTSPRTPWKTRFTSIPRAWGIVFIAIVVMGGLISGIFTPTEAGSIGAFAAFLAVVVLRKGGWRNISQILIDSGELTAKMLFIIMGALMFGYMLSVTHLPTILGEFMVTLNVPPLVIIIAIMAMYVVLGAVMDDFSIMVATLPIIYPLILELGFSPIWFGVLMVQQVELSVITPPYGIHLFLMKGLLPDTSMGDIFRAVLWFIVPLVITMAIYIAFPQVALWLPSLMS
jgi:tripartite ATP-independent transporter DctM subunit